VALAPSGSTRSLPAGEGPRYLPLELHGFYTVRPPGTDPARPFVMAVNVDLEESNLATIDPEELVLQITASSAAQPEPGQNLAQAAELQRADQERRQSLWRWLLIGALALLIGETVLSNWVSRRSVGAHGVVTG
jgi:hypothetical protein